MFDHVTIRVADRAASERFYKTVFTPLGIETSYRTNAFTEWQDFSLTESDADHAVTRGLHIGFAAPSIEQVDDFWESGTGAGYADDGAPGPRTQYRRDYYGAFLRDPDGNSMEAVHHGDLRRGGIIDHLWLRVADVAAARAFYLAIAPFAGYSIGRDDPDRVSFVAPGGGSFTLVSGPSPSANVHLAFGTTSDDDVRGFHAAGTAAEAGGRSGGEPGERPQYHPGYFAAYVLDPDGNNIEVVNHHRDAG